MMNDCMPTKDRAARLADVYTDAFIRIGERFKALALQGKLSIQSPQRDMLRKQTAFLLVKFIPIRYRVDKNLPFLAEAENFDLRVDKLGILWDLVSTAKALLCSFTPQEIHNLFPPDKIFDGEQHQEKDYFTTMEAVRSLPVNKPVGEDQIDHFLMRYRNKSLFKFTAAEFSIADELLKSQGKPSIAEQWAEKEGIRTYTEFTNDDGKQYLRDNQTGQLTRMRKPRPHGIRLLRGMRDGE